MLREFLPSMFHRRLALLAGLGAAAWLALGAQMARLTLVRGEEYKRESRARLYRSQWIPSSRGAILDRKGRVLAQDRPSYNVVVAYRVITGEWAEDEAKRSARESAGYAWWEMSPEQRARRVALRVPIYQRHLDRAWDELSRLGGVSREVIEQRKDAIVQSVEALYARTVEFRRVKGEAEVRELGRAISDRDRREIEKRARQPIYEQQKEHVLLARVADEVAFACLLRAGTETPLSMPEEGRAGEEMGEQATARVDLIPGLSVSDTGAREYPAESDVVEVDRATLPADLKGDGVIPVRVDGLACHLLGRVRDRVQAGDAEARAAYLAGDEESRREAVALDWASRPMDRGEYREGDRVGDSGLEGSREHRLRGLRGLRITRLDTGESSRHEARPGRDVRLSIDIKLQARVQAAMTPALGLSVVQPWHQVHRLTPEGEEIVGAMREGSAIHGAAVVMDVDTGELLAMVSMPTFTREQIRERPQEVFADTPELRVSTPYLNRAIARGYQPGSIVKAPLLAQAISAGRLGLDERLACTGHLLPNNPNMYRCWIFKQQHATHHDVYGEDLRGRQAVAGSCNIFFFTVGQRLGPAGIVSAYKALGVCRPLALGAGMEHPGELGPARPDPQREGRLILGDGAGVSMGDAIQMGIGQGPVTWTPVHAAGAMAALARGGVWLPPRLVIDEPIGEPQELGLAAPAVDEAMGGLWDAVNDPKGTGNHLRVGEGQEPIFNVPGVKIWGKTGTASSSPVVGDPDGEDGPEPRRVLRSGDHSWFVLLVGTDRPRYSIAVVSEFAGSGAKVSGPIANQIVHALVREGYLGGTPAGEGQAGGH